MSARDVPATPGLTSKSLFVVLEYGQMNKISFCYLPTLCPPLFALRTYHLLAMLAKFITWSLLEPLSFNPIHYHTISTRRVIMQVNTYTIEEG